MLTPEERTLTNRLAGFIRDNIDSSYTDSNAAFDLERNRFTIYEVRKSLESGKLSESIINAVDRAIRQKEKIAKDEKEALDNYDWDWY